MLYYVFHDPIFRRLPVVFSLLPLQYIHLIYDKHYPFSIQFDRRLQQLPFALRKWTVGTRHEYNEVGIVKYAEGG